MKLLIGTMTFLSLIATNVYADGHEQKEEEKSGLYYDGNIEMYIDGEWPEGDMSSRAEISQGFKQNLKKARLTGSVLEHGMILTTH